MSSPSAPARCFIGWDVGGWNCERNSASRDAIVILDEALQVVGQPWRGNLRACIAASGSTDAWLRALFQHCRVAAPEPLPQVTMAIDTPLGFSDEFVRLATRQASVEVDEVSGRNRYLFRYTERHLFERGLKPLSAIKDMIGSQATKGMHVLARFAPHVESCGVWTDGAGLRAIETYPAACRNAPAITKLLQGGPTLGHVDLDDARVCALIAYLFAHKRELLEEPPVQTSSAEGWIWTPRSA